MSESRQKLYEGDKHGCVESALVEKSIRGGGSMRARVTFWLRSDPEPRHFECHNSEADVIAVRLTTPVREAP